MNARVRFTFNDNFKCIRAYIHRYGDLRDDIKVNVRYLKANELREHFHEILDAIDTDHTNLFISWYREREKRERERVYVLQEVI